MDSAACFLAIAAAVQAAPAAVVAVLTYNLVRATREYVSLTHRLADAARAQQQAYTAQREADRDRFKAAVERLCDPVRGLPDDRRMADRMRRASLWVAEDINALVGLPAIVETR